MIYECFCLLSSANIGVFLCLKCCGVHRSLGPQISKVIASGLITKVCPLEILYALLVFKSFTFLVLLSQFSRYPVPQVLSVTLDDWTDEEIDAFIEVGGNVAANKIYEAHLPEGVTKPKRDASHEERAKYIR